MTFGQRLRGLRVREGLSQRDLATRVGADYTYISKLETGHGEARPSVALVRRLALELNTDADNLAILAGHIPDDVMAYLRSGPAAIEAVRSLMADMAETAALRSHASVTELFGAAEG